MDLSVEFAPTLTSTLTTNEIIFLLDSVIVEDRPVIVEDITEDSVMIIDNTVIVEDTTKDTVENIVIDDSVPILDIITVEDTVENIVMDNSVTIVDSVTVTVENVVQDCVEMDIDDSSDSCDSYSSDRSRSRKYMSKCPIWIIWIIWIGLGKAFAQMMVHATACK